jgi:1,2-dihydroxy-3-keto-5-methylthiopentene dioxygenase
MTTLTIHRADGSGIAAPATDKADDIAKTLRKIDIEFERWPVRDLPVTADSQAVLDAYQGEIDKLNERYGFVTVDAVRMTPEAPNAAEMRAKFLSEHTHDDDEVRFFVEGSGAFYIREDDLVYQIVCTQGDLISVPRGKRHWFDTGAKPSFAAIRFFTNPKGWEADFTGDDVAKRIPLYESRAA